MAGVPVVKVNAGFVGPGQTAKEFLGLAETSISATTTVAWETVATKKTLYITDIYISSAAPFETEKMLDIRLQAAGVDIFRAGVHSLVPIDMPGIETQPFAGQGTAVTLLLPKTVAVQKVWYFLAGFEQ